MPDRDATPYWDRPVRCRGKLRTRRRAALFLASRGASDAAVVAFLAAASADPVEMARAKDTYTEEKGPRGGRVWVNDRTGKTTRSNPNKGGGDGDQGGGPPAAAGDKKGGPKPKPTTGAEKVGAGDKGKGGKKTAKMDPKERAIRNALIGRLQDELDAHEKEHAEYYKRFPFNKEEALAALK